MGYTSTLDGTLQKPEAEGNPKKLKDKTKWKQGEQKVTLGSRELYKRQFSLYTERMDGTWNLA